jgi:hypothetical protein
MRAKTVNFDRSGDPLTKMGIGHFGIKRALLDNPVILDSPYGDAAREWMNELPVEIQEALDYNPSDPLAFTDYFGFDEDYYLENEVPESVDTDEFQAEFRSISRKKTVQRSAVKSMHRTSVQYEIGKLPDGSKVIRYVDGMGSGYIAKKDWLK